MVNGMPFTVPVTLALADLESSLTTSALVRPLLLPPCKDTCDAGLTNSQRDLYMKMQLSVQSSIALFLPLCCSFQAHSRDVEINMQVLHLHRNLTKLPAGT